MTSGDGVRQFVAVNRVPFSGVASPKRSVYMSELSRNANGISLEHYMAEKVPLFYRHVDSIARTLEQGYFLSAIQETLLKLPTSEHFRESHFGEIASAVFADEVMGLRKVYSKLRLLTSENSNAYKMDLVLYDPETDPVELLFAEVKSSPKTADEGLPAGHDSSCFASIFTSLNGYADRDLKFDLTAANDHLESLPCAEQERLRTALMPYSSTPKRYVAFAIIDTSTKCDDEVAVLATRRNDKKFDVDLVCMEGFPHIAQAVYEKLERLRELSS